MNRNDEIVEEVRAWREAYCAQFGYDLARILEDLKKSEERHPERIATLQPVPVR